MLNYSERWKLQTLERKNRAIARVGATGITALTPPDMTETIAERVVDLKTIIEESEGSIDFVMPLEGNILVAVREFSDHTGEDLGEPGDFFNSFGIPEEELPLMGILMPLDNVLPDITTVKAEDFIGKRVKVYLSNGVAFRAELISSHNGENFHASGINPIDLQMAAEHSLPIPDFLRWVGYPEEAIDDYLKMKAGDYATGTIFRFKNESYFDRDVAKSRGMDVFLEDPLKYILGRNYEPMKDKLCHVPIIMFSAR